MKMGEMKRIKENGKRIVKGKGNEKKVKRNEQKAEKESEKDIDKFKENTKMFNRIFGEQVK